MPGTWADRPVVPEAGRRAPWPVAWWLLGLFATPLPGADESGNYAVWGKGKTSCIAYVRDRDAGEALAHRDFLMGFLTAVNLLMDDTYNIAGDKALEDILVWLDEYCAARPMSSFEAAISSFTTEHFAARLRRAGRQW